MTVLEDIETEVLSRLENITEENSYAFNVGTVSREDRDRNQWNPSVRDVIVVRGDSEPNETYSCPGAELLTAYDVTFEINGFHKQLDIETGEPGIVDKNVTEETMRAAIQKAVTNSDPATWHTFGVTGCHNARFVSVEPKDEPGFDVTMVGLLVTYRHKESDAAVGA